MLSISLIFLRCTFRSAHAAPVSAFPVCKKMRIFVYGGGGAKAHTGPAQIRGPAVYNWIITGLTAVCSGAHHGVLRGPPRCAQGPTTVCSGAHHVFSRGHHIVLRGPPRCSQGPTTVCLGAHHGVLKGARHSVLRGPTQYTQGPSTVYSGAQNNTHRGPSRIVTKGPCITVRVQWPTQVN